MELQDQLISIRETDDLYHIHALSVQGLKQP